MLWLPKISGSSIRDGYKHDSFIFMSPSHGYGCGQWCMMKYLQFFDRRIKSAELYIGYIVNGIVVHSI